MNNERIHELKSELKLALLGSRIARLFAVAGLSCMIWAPIFQIHASITFTCGGLSLVISAMFGILSYFHRRAVEEQILEERWKEDARRPVSRELT